MKRHFVALLSAVVILTSDRFAVRLQAQAPVLPHAFYGSVEINGSPAPIGTQVEARGTNVLPGIESNPLAVAEAGRYGGSGAFAAKLIVQGKIVNDTPITFYVNGAEAECAVQGGVWQSSYPFRSGAVTELLLRVGGSSGSTSTPTFLPTTRPTVTPTKTAPPSLTSTPAFLPTAQPTANPTESALSQPVAMPTSQAAVESRPTEASATVIPTTTPTTQAANSGPMAAPLPRATVSGLTPVAIVSATSVAGPAREPAPTVAADTPVPTVAARFEAPVATGSAPAGAQASTPAAVARLSVGGAKPILMHATKTPEGQRVSGSTARADAPARATLWLGLAALALAGFGTLILSFFVRRR